MTKKMLIGYATESGSTAEVAHFIGDTLTKVGAQVTIHSVQKIESIDAYDAVWIGSPIINGKCKPEIKRLMRSHMQGLRIKPVAFFITCMRLSQVEGDPLPEVPLFIDPIFGEPKPRKAMTFLEKNHSVMMYLKSILKPAKGIRPVSISFFKGVLDYNTINFMMTLLFKFMARFDGLEPGDYRNWEAMGSWARKTHSAL